MLLSEAVSLAPGSLLEGKFRLTRLLGQGGMGSVWEADHLALSTRVAIKFISPEVASGPEALARFRREASAAAQIRSPHVVQVFDHGVTSDGYPYIVMELLEGQDLRARIKERGPLPLSELELIVVQIAKALGKAHSVGIVHRDVKPENVFLVDSDGEPFVKLLDFGIAKRTEDAGFGVTKTGALVGTPYFMSPEQVMSAKGVDHRTDLWSVGVVVYNALTGSLPFDAPTLGALCVAINDAKFRRPTELRPELPPAIDTWMARALARQPEARFGSAKEMADALREALRATEVMAATPETLVSPAASVVADGPHQTLVDATMTTPGARRSRIHIVLGALLVPVVGAAVILVVVLRAKSAPPADDAFGQPPALVVTEEPPVERALPLASPPAASPAPAVSSAPSAEPPAIEPPTSAPKQRRAKLPAVPGTTTASKTASPGKPSGAPPNPTQSPSASTKKRDHGF